MHVAEHLEMNAGAIELEQLAGNIRKRDRHFEELMKTNWLHNGIDLLRAKQLVGHGKFEKWCKEKLSYSKSKAEKMMAAASVLGERLKSVDATDLPPRTLACAVSAPSVPEDIRESYIESVLAGDKSAGSTLKRALTEFRLSKRPKSDADVADPELEIDNGPCDHPREIVSRAVALIVKKFGADLPSLLALIGENGEGSVFTYEAQKQLEALSDRACVGKMKSAETSSTRDDKMFCDLGQNTRTTH